MPKILNIITNPNKILREKSININPEEINDKELKTLFEDMILTMVEKDGVGLAAPQIGKNIRLIVVNTKNGPVGMINPIFTKKSWSKEWGEEGCLSVPNTFGKVRRHKRVTCVYLDENGQKKKIEAKGFYARILQHEVDHLDAILFIDKAKDVKTMKKK